MRNDLRWDTNIKIDETLIRKFEKERNFKFPDSYVEIVKNHDGAQPEVRNDKGEWKTGIVKINNKFEKYDTFGFISFVETFKLQEIYWYFLSITPQFEKENIIPFAFTGIGNNYFLILDKKIMDIE